MTLLTPLWAQDGKYPAQLDRLALAGSFTPGVFSLDHCKVTPRLAGANMSVDVAAGMVSVPDGLAGCYLCASDATENVAITSAPAAGTTRIDSIVARVSDAYATGQGTGLTWRFEAIPGTPAASGAVPPTLPAFTYELARVTVAAGTGSITSAMIASWRGFAVSSVSHAVVNSVQTTSYGAIGTGGWWKLGETNSEMIGPCLVFTHLQHDVSLLTGNSMQTRILVRTRGYEEINPVQQIFFQASTNFINRVTNTQTSMSMIDADGSVHCEVQATVPSSFSSPQIHAGIYMSMIIPTTAESLRMTGDGANTNPIRPPWWQNPTFQQLDALSDEGSFSSAESPLDES